MMILYSHLSKIQFIDKPKRNLGPVKDYQTLQGRASVKPYLYNTDIGPAISSISSFPMLYC